MLNFILFRVSTLAILFSGPPKSFRLGLGGMTEVESYGDIEELVLALEAIGMVRT